MDTYQGPQPNTDTDVQDQSRPNPELPYSTPTKLGALFISIVVASIIIWTLSIWYTSRLSSESLAITVGVDICFAFFLFLFIPRSLEVHEDRVSIVLNTCSINCHFSSIHKFYAVDGWCSREPCRQLGCCGFIRRWKLATDSCRLLIIRKKGHGKSIEVSPKHRQLFIRYATDALNAWAINNRTNPEEGALLASENSQNSAKVWAYDRMMVDTIDWNAHAHTRTHTHNTHTQHIHTQHTHITPTRTQHTAHFDVCTQTVLFQLILQRLLHSLKRSHHAIHTVFNHYVYVLRGVMVCPILVCTHEILHACPLRTAVMYCTLSVVQQMHIIIITRMSPSYDFINFN